MKPSDTLHLLPGLHLPAKGSSTAEGTGEMCGGDYLTAGSTPMRTIMQGHSAKVLAEKAQGTRQVALIINNEASPELIETIRAWYYKVNCDVVVFAGREVLAKLPIPQIGCRFDGADMHVLPLEQAEEFGHIVSVAWPAACSELAHCNVRWLSYTSGLAEYVLRFGDHV